MRKKDQGNFSLLQVIKEIQFFVFKMKVFGGIVAIAMLLSAVEMQEVPKKSLGASCSDSIQCSSRYCYDGKCIEWGTIPGEGGYEPCSYVRCVGPCVIDQGRCPRRSCPGRASCRGRI